MHRRMMWLAAAAVVAAIVTATVAASPPDGPALTNVPNANTKSTGFAPPDVLSPQLQQAVVAQGATKVENPSAAISYYGYDNDLLNQNGDPVMVPADGFASEAHKTEPDKNTYLVFKDGLAGADPVYNYETHFLFQGHETGSPGYVTRINLDADAAHRVTVLATKDSTGADIADIDGSTWDPWAKRLLFTTENQNAPTYAATPNYPSTVTDVSGALGRGGYEGIQNDSAGNIWIVEDIGGSNKPGTVAKRPNSFVYRYVSQTPGDLAHGKLEALQVLNQSDTPITFDT
jgi:secreted PhoX family phosphatase